MKYKGIFLCGLMIIILSLIATYVNAQKFSYDYKVKVVAITDGDTFKGLTKDNKQITFRLYAIDAPEKQQAYGNKSKQYLSSLIYGKEVMIKTQKKADRYKRPVVWVYTADGKDVCEEMLKAGMAWHYKKFDNTPRYADLEIEAKQKQMGLWADNNPTAPWDFRKAKKNVN